MAQESEQAEQPGLDPAPRDTSLDPAPRRPHRRTLRVTLCSATLAAALSLTLAPAFAVPPPPNPSDAQLNQAQNAKQAMADKVGNLSAMVLQAQNQLDSLKAQVELAEQKSAFALSQLADAKAQAAAAQLVVTAAEKAVTTARTNLGAFVHDSYIQRSVTSGAGNLLSASDPNALLQRGDYLRYVSDRHLDAIAALDRATIARSNAVAKARSLVLLQQKYSDAAAAAQVVATQAAQAQKLQTAQLQANLVSFQGQLADAQVQLATLNGQRATYLAYVKEQARLAAEKAERERKARLAAEALARKIAAQNAARAAAAAAAAAAAREAAARAGQSTGGTATGTAVIDPTPLPAAGSMGGWSAAAGQDAANRAQHWLGQPYAWAGGGYNGPTFGVNSPGTDGWNDSTVYGFDCSGLSMYAWAGEGLYLAHYAATQFTQAGSVHPSAGNFMPGDLLFWSSNGSIGGIHHVAIYVGGGNVIQAPNSGSHVQITPWDQVSSDYFGATRPLT